MITQAIIISTYALIFLLISFLVFQHFPNKEYVQKREKKKSLAEEFAGQKVLIDGEINHNFYAIVKLLKQWNVEVQHKMSTETGILITGRNPDDFVVEEAKTFGAKIYSVEAFLALSHVPSYILNRSLKSVRTATIKVKS